VDKIIRRVLASNDLKNYDIAYRISFGDVTNGMPEYSTANFDNITRQINADSAYRLNSVSYTFPINPQMIGGAVLISNEWLTIVMSNISRPVWYSLIWIIAGSALLTLITIAAFYLAIRTMLQQLKLNKMKNDFINNMTHEFKTPLATISLAVDALHSPKVKGNAEQTVYFSDIIKEENKKMNKHVETILQAAFMEKQEFNLNTEKLNVHDIIQGLVDTFALQLQDKQGEITLLLNAKNDVISGDEVQITNLINNLIDNAVKYSKPDVPPQIVITTSNTAKNLIIQIKDNGIGMSKDAVKRIFEKFYRAHTGNVHNVKGFGLGMSYVKDIITAHKGKIKVDSAVGRGSTFTAELPLAE
jgi:two-component system phosphate regulon sensor histidine kinase PhoR